MEDGGFEIEIILQEKPKSNVFAFQIEAAQDLDFFDQPKLSPEEIAEGAVRPENAIGSNAVYPKTKANHRVGDTPYSTGKARHTNRSEGIFSDFASEVHTFWTSLLGTSPVVNHTKASRKLLAATLANQARAFRTRIVGGHTGKHTPWDGGIYRMNCH